MIKRDYIKPNIKCYTIDQDISLVMMSYGDEDNPPPPPGAAQQSNSFEENPFDENNLE
ncbi:hypothetical protein [Carboxylicivirga sp. RSCT41]|uniref:hypothetical protein n=1 Tax=Carboxylicivirga agarovorans TaxID=3417570 RepID=UPI003D345B9F